MTITSRVQQQFFTDTTDEFSMGLIRLPPTVILQYDVKDIGRPSRAQLTLRQRAVTADKRPQLRRAGLWAVDEHERFLDGLEMYPRGPWKQIAAHVGTKTTRQTMTHAQKYREKIRRWQRMMDARPNKTKDPVVLQPFFPGAMDENFRISNSALQCKALEVHTPNGATIEPFSGMSDLCDEDLEAFVDNFDMADLCDVDPEPFVDNFDIGDLECMIEPSRP